MEHSTLAMKQFESAVFEHYHQYVARMDPEATHNRSPRQGGSRGIQDILQRYPPERPPSPEATAVIIGYKSVEYLLPDYSKMISKIVRDNPSQLRFNMFWTGEEAMHGWALDEYLVASGARTRREVEQDYRETLQHEWDPLVFNSNFADPWYSAVTYVTLQEKATALGYSALAKVAEREGQTALKLICKRLAGEESRHFAFYYGIAKLAASFNFKRLSEALTLATEEFAMPGKYAYLRKEDTPQEEKETLKGYEEWTRVAQNLGTVPDPLFAVRTIARAKRGRLLNAEEWQNERQRITCWNNYTEAFRDIFKGLEIPMTSPRLQNLVPIPSPA